MIKKTACLILIALFFVMPFIEVLASSPPTDSYNFDHWDEYIPTPLPYVPQQTISGITLGVDPFSRPADMFVCNNGDLFIVDTGNDRLVLLDEDLSLKKIIDSFTNNGVKDTFSAPQGVFVMDNGNIYVADTGNNRIVAFTPDGVMFQLIDELPEVAETVSGFIPQKVTVNADGRVFVIAQNIFQGILCYSPESEFIAFFGKIEVNVSPWDWLWRLLSTQEQRSRQRLFIPMEFNNMDLDYRGFLFTTNIDTTNQQRIKRLNPAGKDILGEMIENRGKTPLIGDTFYPLRGAGSGPSLFVDIKARSSGMYSALDVTRCRIFTYDSEGNLLYVFGGIGHIEGMLLRPAAIDVLNNKILVMDQLRGDIVVYTETEYGREINLAVQARYEGREMDAVEHWQRVLHMDAHYELAYAGVGKSLLASGQNEEAMEYLKKGNEPRYYSIALRRYRTDVMKDFSGVIFTVIVLSAVGLVVYRILRKPKEGANQDA